MASADLLRADPQAANYLNIKTLLDLTCKTVADMIKGKTPEEIRKTFNVRVVVFALCVRCACVFAHVCLLVTVHAYVRACVRSFVTCAPMRALTRAPAPPGTTYF